MTAAAPRVDVLGVGVSAVNMTSAVEAIEQRIASEAPGYVTVTGVHGVMESRDARDLQEIHDVAFLVVPDGMPMVWMCKWAGHRHAGRVYGPDLMLALCERSLQRGYTHYLYGGAAGVPELLSSRLKDRFPGIRIVGAFSPPFRPLTDAERRAVADEINESEASIVWVGLSTPKQERWMSEMVPLLDRAVLIGVGAAFDFNSGLKRQAPRWMQGIGMEWFYRMITEPRRLGRRYLKNNPRFVGAVLLQLSGFRRVELREPPQ